MKFFILTKDSGLAESLKRYFHYVWGFGLDHLFPCSLMKDNEYDRLSACLHICKYLEKIGVEEEWEVLRNTVVFVDNELKNLVDPFLILAFPEIHWVYLQIKLQDPENQSKTAYEQDWHYCNPLELEESLKEIMKARFSGYQPLFDPLGFRNVARIKNIEKIYIEGKNEAVPNRYKQAVAIDEETSYSFIHAYTAYKFGYKTFSVTTLGMMKEIFKEESNYNYDCDLSLEDLYLNFPDKKNNIPLSSIDTRHKECPKLEEVSNRVFITVGHTQGKQKGIRKRLKDYKEEQRQKGEKFKILYKPLAGIYDLKEKIPIKGKDTDFIWPPKKISNAELRNDGHSAPGEILKIAEQLISSTTLRIINSVSL